MLDMDIKIGHKNIWYMPEMFILIALIISLLPYVLCEFNAGILITLVLIVFVLSEIVFRVIKYNHLVNNGRLCIGIAKTVLIYGPYIYFKIQYTDEKSGNSYFYKDIAVMVHGVELEKILKKNPEIYIMIDPYMPQRGIVLYQDFIKIMQKEIQHFWYDEINEFKDKRGF